MSPNHFFHLFASPGICQFNKPRSSSVDLLIESSLSAESNISPLSKTNRNKKSEESSYLVVGAGKGKKEGIYVNYQSEVNKSKISSAGTDKNHSMSLSTNSQVTSDKPETSSNSTIFTVAPSISSSSSSSYTPSSKALNSPVRVNNGVKSPSSLHDSTISRLIDAVSLGNEQDTCCSISALIDQFENTVDQSNPILSPDITLSQASKLRPTTPKALENIRSSLKTNASSPKKNLVMSPQKATQKPNHVKSEICSPHKVSSADTHTPSLISSPETAELEEVYTILDEDVLLPVSVYNLRKQTVHIQADTTEISPSNSSGTSPAKTVHSLGKGPSVAWTNVERSWGESEKSVETEERIYEEVNDPPTALFESEHGPYKSYTSSSSNNSLQIFHHSGRGTFTEVELNVDEDPLETHRGNHWEAKHDAIYQNHAPTPTDSQQKHPSSYPQLHYQKHASHTSFSQFPSLVNQPSRQLFNHHQPQGILQPPVHHKYINHGPSNPGPVHQNSYPMCQSNSEVFNNSRDFSISNTQQRNLSSNQIKSQEKTGNKQIKTERDGYSYNGFSSAENLPVSLNLPRERDSDSSSFECKTLYSQLDYDCIIPSSEPCASQNIKPQSQSQTKLYGPKHFGMHKTNVVNKKIQPHSETRVPFPSDLESSSVYLSATSGSKTPSPCKSKSLGDLTSEDISCNFQSKYHIISRSFVTSHMRKQKHKGTAGEASFHSQSLDPLTQQLRKLVSLEADDGIKESLQPPQLQQEVQFQASNLSPDDSRDLDESPPTLTRRLSSRSQSRVRHINSRARERQQEALKPRPGVVINSTSSLGGVVRRNKPALQNLPPNRHSTGSYIAGYLGELDDRGLPEGACTSISYGNGDSLGDLFYTDNSLPPSNASHSASEPEVYFLLRL